MVDEVGFGDRDDFSLNGFDSLRAEDESWLLKCFVQPDNFGQMASPASMIILGEPGSGKSAVHKRLYEPAWNDPIAHARLPVNWQISPLMPEQPGAMSKTIYQIGHLLDVCAQALAAFLGRRPHIYQTAPPWAQKCLNRSIYTLARQGDLAERMGPIIYDSPPEGAELLSGIESQFNSYAVSRSKPDEALKEMVSVLKTIGIGSMWVLVDGLENWYEVDPADLTKMLDIFLSTLGLFEKQHLVYKLFLPIALEESVNATRAVTSWRTRACRIAWKPDRLQKLVERRLEFALDQPGIKLSDLSQANDLLPWLKRTVGHSPRAWLEQIRPLALKYRQEANQPVSIDDWKDLRRGPPPEFRLDERSLEARVNGHALSLKGLGRNDIRLLTYCYRRPGVIISREEAYYLGYLGEMHILKPGDKSYETPNDYRSRLDQAIYRIRKVIEPDPHDPIILVTVRNYGLRLEAL
jgi:hypothetical protein